MSRPAHRLAFGGLCLLVVCAGQPGIGATDGASSPPGPTVLDETAQTGAMASDPEEDAAPLRSLDELAAARARRLARDILEQDQFRHAFDEAPTFDASEELSVYLSRFVRWLASLSRPVQWTLVVLCILALLAIGAHLWYVLKRVLAVGPLEPAPAPDRAPAAVSDSAGERLRAEQAAAEGDYSGALRHLHRYLRLELERRRLLPYHEHWTNWEYLQALSRSGLPLEPLRAFTARCDHVFYREARGTREDYQASLEALARVFEATASNTAGVDAAAGGAAAGGAAAGGAAAGGAAAGEAAPPREER